MLLRYTLPHFLKLLAEQFSLLNLPIKWRSKRRRKCSDIMYVVQIRGFVSPNLVSSCPPLNQARVDKVQTIKTDDC